MERGLSSAAEIALGGQRVVPEALERAGFPFDFPTIEEAFKDIIST
jgi:NAD dependent epimerase/dehydratase family enzyme